MALGAVRGSPEETDMRLFSSPAFDDHEEVTFFYDRPSGLRAIVAIHDRTLGPAMGGSGCGPTRTARRR